MSAELFEQTLVAIVREADIVLARQAGRALAQKLGLTGSDPMFVATAISEIARNVLVHAGGGGEVVLAIVENGERRGVRVVVRDRGPGIADVALAMQEGYSTVKSLGLGLPGARRLMDDFEIVSTVGVGTTVTMTKWSRTRGGRF